MAGLVGTTGSTTNISVAFAAQSPLKERTSRHFWSRDITQSRFWAQNGPDAFSGVTDPNYRQKTRCAARRARSLSGPCLSLLHRTSRAGLFGRHGGTVENDDRFRRDEVLQPCRELMRSCLMSQKIGDGHWQSTSHADPLCSKSGARRFLSAVRSVSCFDTVE